jgi:hypothetical protein
VDYRGTQQDEVATESKKEDKVDFMTAMIENRKQKEREQIFKVEEYFPSIEVDEKIV